MTTVDEIKAKVSELDAKLRNAGFVNAWVSTSIWKDSVHVHVHYMPQNRHGSFSNSDAMLALADAEVEINRICDCEQALARTLGIEMAEA